MIKKYKKRIYTLVLALLLALVPLARSNADAPFQKKPKYGPNYSYYDHRVIYSANIHFGYDSGLEWRWTGEYNEVWFCRTHGDHCPPDEYDKCDDDYYLEKVMERYQARPESVTGPYPAFANGQPSPPKGFSTSATNNVSHEFVGLSYIGASPATPTLPAMVSIGEVKHSGGTMVSGFCAATFRWGAAGAMSNAPAPKPGLTVNPTTSWTFHNQTVTGTGIVAKDSDGDGVHYHLTASGPYSYSGKVTSWTTPTHLPPFSHPTGTMNYKLEAHDDFGEGSTVTATGVVRAT